MIARDEAGRDALAMVRQRSMPRSRTSTPRSKQEREIGAADEAVVRQVGRAPDAARVPSAEQHREVARVDHMVVVEVADAGRCRNAVDLETDLTKRSSIACRL